MKWTYLAGAGACWIMLSGLVLGQGTGTDAEIPQPEFRENSLIYADIDTASQQVFLVLEDELWRYDLPTDSWIFLDSLTSFPEQLQQMEFGYNSGKQRLQFWSEGIGHMYEMEPGSGEIRRTDNSVNHLNQSGHSAFYRRDTLYAFGGYGFWRWENILIYYNDRIGEWNIQNVTDKSEFPPPRVPLTGVYLHSHELYMIWGGETPEGGRPDDQITKKINLRDLWGYSFQTNSWESYGSLPESEYQYYRSNIVSPLISSVNTVSSSFYDPDSDYWFIPVHRPDQLNAFTYVKPVKPKSAKNFRPIQLDIGDPNHFRPSNFLFNPATDQVIVVGIDKLNHSDWHPISIHRVAVSELTSRIDQTIIITDLISVSLWGGLLIVLVAAFVWWGRATSVVKEKVPSDQLPITFENLVKMELFTKQESELIRMLHSKKEMLESHELEELVWPDINNYDYRRRLRNDLIKTINDKFEEKFEYDELIQRVRDREDQRKFLYGLNREYIRD